MATNPLRETVMELRRLAEMESRAADELEKVILAREQQERTLPLDPPGAVEAFSPWPTAGPESVSGASQELEEALATSFNPPPTHEEVFGKYAHSGKLGASPSGRYSAEGYARQLAGRRARMKRERAAKLAALHQAKRASKLRTMPGRKAA